MGPQARQEYLAQMRERYLGASRRAKGALLDEAVAVTGYHRKALIRAWRRPDGAPPRGPRPGRPTAMGRSWCARCGRSGRRRGIRGRVRLKALLAAVAAVGAAAPGAVDRDGGACCARSARARWTACWRRTSARSAGACTAARHRGPLLKHHIPIKTDRWDVHRAGLHGDRFGDVTRATAPTASFLTR